MHNGPTANRREFLGGALATSAAAPSATAAHPGWTRTRGGEDGAVLRVTTLAGTGDGSLLAAIRTRGPRKIVFDVGGVIDLGLERFEIDEPYVTIAGETAPEPGITLIRGGFWATAHDVIVRHIAVRPGTAGQSRGWEPDGLTAYGAHDVIVDQCSFSWGVDENLSASGKRFLGAGLEEWRRNTSHRITFSNNIVAEALSHATHEEGEHSKGTLIHDNCTEVLLHRNLYAHNRERHPLAKGGSQSAIVNNVFVNPGNRCAQYNLVAREWEGHAPVSGKMAFVGNVMRGGADTVPDLPMLMVGGAGDLELFEADNIATYADGSAAPVLGYSNTGRPEIRRERRREPWPSGLTAASASDVEALVYAQCGMRPWARNAVDARILREARAGTGRIIDSESEVGGYP
jgi:pectate lyase